MHVFIVFMSIHHKHYICQRQTVTTKRPVTKDSYSSQSLPPKDNRARPVKDSDNDNDDVAVHDGEDDDA